MGIGKRKKLEFVCKHSDICIFKDEVKNKPCTEEYTKKCEYFKSYETYGDGYNHLGI